MGTTPVHEEGDTYPFDGYLMSLDPVRGFQFWEGTSGDDPPTMTVVCFREHRWVEICLDRAMAAALGVRLTDWANPPVPERPKPRRFHWLRSVKDSA